jgi:hypothetical protein
MPATTVAELSRVNEWILSSLIGDPALSNLISQRVYADQAPQGAISPMVVFSFLGGSDRLVTGSTRLSRCLYLIRGIAQGSSYSLVNVVADRIEAAMFVPQAGTIVRAVRITTVFREQPFQRKDDENGIPYVHMGGIYRIGFQPSIQ